MKSFHPFPFQSVHSNTVSPKYRPQQHYSRKRGGGAARRREGRVRNSGVRDFSLSLTSYVVFGEATLMLGLSTSAEYSQWGLHGQALVVSHWLACCRCIALLYYRTVVRSDYFPQS